MQPVNKERQRKIRQSLASVPKANSQERQIYELNKVASPFLRLPGEIRNRIYELVLDVGQIHVRYKRWEHRRKNGQLGYETIPGGFHCLALKRRQNPWASGGVPISNKRGMTLLSGICRQLYHETSALPFGLNYWSFENVGVMDRLFFKEKRVTRAQRRAITTVFSELPLTTTHDKAFEGLEQVLLKHGGKMVRLTRINFAGQPYLSWEVKTGWWV
ncbi:hypothetical protein OQA88_10720 [Cercophora sp. LCS_1]